MTVLTVLGAVAAVLGGLVAAGRLLRGAWRANRRLMRIADAVIELTPNSGHSVKDVVHRTEEKVDALRVQLDDHIDNHPGS